ncbi:alpha/beta fold hydrolase [Carboxylicivirga taeanensis]|uniref:alpha/beta fold hydrolase n=1 Tax=Carboxylicivirga taeanensis TaxID=1416875 RepID=UPI003F6DD7B5
MRKILLMIITGLALSACNPYKHIAQMESMTKDLQYKFPVKYAQLPDDLNIAYVDEGKGEKTLIFIHGLGSYIPAWRHEIEKLSGTYRCIALDLPGYGKSDKPPHSGLMSYYARTVHAFINELGLSNYTLIGHSMGGQISMTYSLMYPDKAEKLVLVAPAGFEKFTDGQRDWFEEVMTPKLVRLTTADAIESNLAFNFYELPDDARFMTEDRLAMRSAEDFPNYCLAVSRSVRGMVTEPIRKKLKDISVPTLIIFGENDNLIPNRYLNPGTTLKIAQYGHQQIPNSQLIMIPKAGHFVGFEKAEEVSDAIESFVQ